MAESPSSRPLVRPRVVSQVTAESLYLEDALEPLLGAAETGAICIFGSNGSGKTSALKHLSTRLPKTRIVELLDEPERARVVEGAERMLVIYTATEPLDLPHLAKVWLAPWGEDEVLEYLLAAHKDQCASVMRRIRASAGRDAVETPELWTICLNEMAADESIGDCDDALRRHLQRRIPPGFLRQARAIAFRKTSRPDAMDADWVTLWGHPGFLGFLLGHGIPKEDIQLLRHPRVRMILAADRLFDHGHRDVFIAGLESGLPRELILRAGKLLRDKPEAFATLERELPGRTAAQPMGASLLHAAGRGWKPSDQTSLYWFRRAYFPRADWPGLRLPNAQFDGADLTGANLRGSRLENAHFTDASLRGATLWGSSLGGVNAIGADLAGADLGHISAAKGLFINANLDGADLESSHLPDARFNGAILRGARFRRANLTGAAFQMRFTGDDGIVESFDYQTAMRILKEKGILPMAQVPARMIDLTDVDFTGAELEGASLCGVDLRHTTLSGARFGLAMLQAAVLEGVEAPGAYFGRAHLNYAVLTGSVMPGATFYRASLYGARLGDVEWEKADLRNADLRKASFHMGSSRSGLVSGEPSEGTRSGFYTDEYYDQSYRAPEEIRTANLRGADLRGALLEGTDFYLVDLREALYTSEQAEYLRRCGAILETRV